VSELHDLLESKALAAEIASAFRDDQQVLRQTRKLVEALNRYQVTLSTRWWGPSSARRRSAITKTGREHGMRLFAAAEQDEPMLVSGLVTALELAGVVTVTSDTGQKYRVEVGELVSDSSFALGTRVAVQTMKSQEVDSIGVSQGWAHYRFLRHLGHPRLDGID
jgi:ATP-dependent 26S proteasome regulatory subunit